MRLVGLKIDVSSAALKAAKPKMISLPPEWARKRKVGENKEKEKKEM